MKLRHLFTGIGLCGLLVAMSGCAGDGSHHGSSNANYTVFFQRVDETGSSSKNRTPGAQSDSEIYACDLNGDNVTQLTFSANYTGNPSASLDASKVVFERTTGSVSSIFSLIRLTNVETQLTTENSYQANISDDGSKVVYVSDEDGDPEIWIMDFDGSNKTKLTDNTAREGNPAFSPDGTHIVFETDRDGVNQIYSMDTAGGSVTRLTNGILFDETPRYSPDGSKIVFARFEGNDDIFVMNASDGSNVTRLTTSSNQDREPVYSPDGKYIFYSSAPDFGYHLHRMNANGSGDTQITNVQDFGDYHPGVVQVGLDQQQ